MGIFDAFAVGVSGLQAQTTNLSSISNNIANSTTVGFKEDVTNFSDLITSDTTVDYSPGGVQTSDQNLVDVQGNIVPDTTTTPTDIAVSGVGMIPVTASPASGSSLLYTRAGSFTQDGNGYLVNGAGYFLQGWPYDATGALPSSLTAASLVPVNTGDLNSASQTTTNIQIQSNLESSQTASTATYSASNSSENMASGSVEPQYSFNTSIVDSTGASHTFTTGFLKTGANTWAVEIYANPATDVTATNGQVASGTLTFNGDGTLASVSPSLQSFGITWPANTATPPVTPNPSTIAVNWGTVGKANGMSQIDSGYNGTATGNGYVAGQLLGVSIDPNGNVVANFSNNVSKDVYQIPLADFENYEALQSMSGNTYAESTDSGAPSFVQAEQAVVAGAISGSVLVPSALEQSNVDLSTQLTNMIIAQRSYDSSSKIITVTDSMLDVLYTMGAT